MSDEVRCPGCDSLQELHPLKTVAPWVCSACTLTPAEIDAVLAMRVPKPVPMFPPAIESTRVLSSDTPLVICGGCGLARSANVIARVAGTEMPGMCPSCGWTEAP